MLGSLHRMCSNAVTGSCGCCARETPRRLRYTLMCGWLLFATAVTAGIVVTGLVLSPREHRIDVPLEYTAVNCSSFDSNSTAIILAFGQSNSANHGSATSRREHPAVGNLRVEDASCYIARSPLLGATGVGGSPWPELADKLLNCSTYERVLIVPFGVGGTTIRMWAPGGEHHPRIATVARALEHVGLRATHVLFHQGESDAHTDPIEYTAAFTSLRIAMILQGLDAPMFVAVASLCGANTRSEPLRAAQQALPDSDVLAGSVFAGPDTDVLGESFRFDGCHFNEQGLTAHADLWFSALQVSGTVVSSRPMTPVCSLI